MLFAVWLQTQLLWSLQCEFLLLFYYTKVFLWAIIRERPVCSGICLFWCDVWHLWDLCQPCPLNCTSKNTCSVSPLSEHRVCGQWCFASTPLPPRHPIPSRPDLPIQNSWSPLHPMIQAWELNTSQPSPVNYWLTHSSISPLSQQEETSTPSQRPNAPITWSCDNVTPSCLGHHKLNLVTSQPLKKARSSIGADGGSGLMRPLLSDWWNSQPPAARRQWCVEWEVVMRCCEWIDLTGQLSS